MFYHRMYLYLIVYLFSVKLIVYSALIPYQYECVPPEKSRTPFHIPISFLSRSRIISIYAFEKIPSLSIFTIYSLYTIQSKELSAGVPISWHFTFNVLLSFRVTSRVSGVFCSILEMFGLVIVSFVILDC